MRRHELTDKQWDRIKDLFPPPAATGRPPRSHRLMFNGILWILRTGAAWRDIPDRFGSWKTVYDRYNGWRKTGLFDRIMDFLQLCLNEQHLIDWDLWCVDGSSIRAHKAAAGGGKKGDPMSLKTTHWGAREADSAASCIW